MPDITPVEITIMGIREKLMRYYKGTCVDSVTEHTGLHLGSITELPSRTYQYQRIEADVRNAALLSLNGVGLLTLRQTPDELVMHMKSLDRSKELKAVRQGVESFMDKYLPGVTIIHNNRLTVARGIKLSKLKNQVDDSKLLTVELKDKAKEDALERLMREEYEQMRQVTHTYTMNSQTHVWTDIQGLYE